MMSTHFENFLNGKQMSTSVIDSHAHLLYSNGPVKFLNTSPAEMVAEMDKYGINQACISIIGAGDRNEETLQAAEDYPDRLLGFFLANPRYPDRILPDLKCAFKSPFMKGIGEIHPTTYQHNYSLMGRNYRPVWEFAEERKLPVLIHSGPTSEASRCSPTLLAEVARQHPEMNVLIGHSGGYESFAMLDEAIGVVQDTENLYLEICAMGRHSRIIEYMVKSVGAEKIIFGTDAPFHDWAPEIANIACAEISDTDKELIFGVNMQRLMNMSV